MRKLILLLGFICFFTPGRGACANEQPAIVIVVASYHNKNLVRWNLDSIFNQNASNYRVIYIADGDLLPDSDGTGATVESYVKERGLESRITLIRNADRHRALRNLYRAFLSCRDDEAIVLVDGDDALAGPNVLSRIRALYNNTDGKEIWFTYGNFKSLSTQRPWTWTQRIPEDIRARNALREWGNGPTHPKTFKAWLAKQVKIEDLFCDADFYQMCYDIALFEPMMEMVGDHFDCTQEVLYLYNDLNVLSDHNVNRDLQIRLDHSIRAKERYAKLPAHKSGWLEHLKEDGHGTADLLVFSKNNQEDLERFLHDITPQLEHHGALIIVPETIDQDLKTRLANSPSEYVVVCATDTNTTNTLPNKCDLTNAIYWLEITHATGFHLMLGQATVRSLGGSPIELTLKQTDTDVYAWRYKYSQKTRLSSFVLVRKSDLLSVLSDEKIMCLDGLEDAWHKKVQESNVGLFYEHTKI